MPTNGSPTDERPPATRCASSRAATWWIPLAVGGALVGVTSLVFVLGASSGASEVGSTSSVIERSGQGDAPRSVTERSEQGDAPAGSALPSCEELAIHIPMAMWNPILADDLLTAGCPWPEITGFQGLEGGTEDLSIEAPFEPHRYQEIFDILRNEKFGMCAVGAVPASDATGLVYGFDIQLHPDTCAEGLAAFSVSIGEYATRALRDQAGAELGTGALVLGRWVITVTGQDAAAVVRMTIALQELGASTIQ